MQVIASVLVPALRDRNLAADWVVGYAPFGLFVAHAAAYTLEARCGYTDPASSYDINFDIRESETVLVVADDIHSGRSVVETIAALERRGAAALPMVFCLVNLSGSDVIASREVVAAGVLEANSYAEGECPLCAQGSAAVTPRPHWRELTGPGALDDPEQSGNLVERREGLGTGST
jgi:orotate phosphoribosyltransferase